MKFIPKQKPLRAVGEQEYEREKYTPPPPPEQSVCQRCSAPLESPAGFCPVCGFQSPKTGREAGMRYPSIKLNENGKALVCPHCENEELTPGDFCIICGNDIVNRCADTPHPENPAKAKKACGAILPGNARYCSRCGNEGTFFQKGWLRDWKSENTRKAIRNINVAIDLSEVREEKA